MSKPTLASSTAYVKINWSESGLLNRSGIIDGDYHPIEEVNKLLRQAADIVVGQDGGYDKTNFSVVTWDTDEPNEWNGRIDLGNEQNGFGLCMIENHIKEYADYFLSEKAPDYLKKSVDLDVMRWWSEYLG